MRAVILAGGKGTRLKDIVSDIPKPMVEVGGKPMLELQVELLKRYGITEIVMLVGYKGEVIEEYFGNGSKWGVRISCRREEVPLGTAGAVKELEKELGEDFLVLYGDVVLDMNLQKLFAFHTQQKAFVTFVVHPNNHPHDSDLIEIDEDSRIVAIHRKPHVEGQYYQNLASAAVYVLSPEVFSYIQRGVRQDLLNDIVVDDVLAKHRLYAYRTAEYIKDAGTPERLMAVRNDYSRGITKRLNNESCRKAIFLDRDGVINEEVGLLSDIDQFELIPGVADAIRAINQTEFLAIVVTNQPVIARNLCSLEQLQMVHNKMETLLGKEGAKLDAIYYCPHHPDGGYPEERSEYKIECDCRKPNIGMISRAEEEFNIDLDNSYIVGDSFRDIQAGRNAGLTTIGVATGKACRDGDVQPEHYFKDLSEAVAFITEGSS